MKLRVQLILVSLLALCVPWAGCTYLYEMENVLRDGQQQAVTATAASVALLIQGRPDLLNALEGEERNQATGQALYLQQVAQIPIADGYLDEDLDLPNGMYRFSETTNRNDALVVEYAGLADGREAYLLFRIADPGVQFHDPGKGGVANGDRLRLSLGQVDGRTQHLWFAPEAPGELLARRVAGEDVVTEVSVRGAWRFTQGGYQLEVTLPLDRLGDTFGFSVFDGEEPQRWAGSMSPAGRPGQLLRTRPSLEALLELFLGTDLRLTVVNNDGWVLASRGELAIGDVYPEYASFGDRLIASFYRWVLARAGDGAEYRSPKGGRLQRREVRDALAGSPGAYWYDFDTTRGTSLISGAFPLQGTRTVAGAVVAEQTTDQILSLTNAAASRLLIVTVVATLLISGGLLLYASLLSFRIARLARHVDAVMDPDRGLRIGQAKSWARDELGDLGRHFDDLAKRVHEYTEYLRTLSSKLSHELRTPMAVVNSSLDNLDHENLSSQANTYLERARQGSARISRILTSMSEASRLEESIQSVEKVRLTLNELILATVSGYRNAYTDYSIECQVPDEQVVVAASPELLAQMLDKLMENAADFSTENRPITFELTTNGEDACIAVCNEGPYLPVAMREQLFDSMVSLRTMRDKQPHLGLGLTVVRLVAEFHGGSAKASNRNDVPGACFQVFLPCIAQAA